MLDRNFATLARRGLLILALLHCTLAAAGPLTVSAAASLTNAFSELAPHVRSAEPRHQGAAQLRRLRARCCSRSPRARRSTCSRAPTRRRWTRRRAQSLVRSRRAAQLRVEHAGGDRAGGRQERAEAASPTSAQAGYARVAIGLPASVPVGRYTKGVLEKAGLWAAIEPKMIGAQNVRQALDYVARGEVDAGFVVRDRRRADARQGQGRADGADRNADPLPDRAGRRRHQRGGGAEVRRLRAVAAGPGRAREARLRQTLIDTAMEGAWTRTGADAEGGRLGHRCSTWCSVSASASGCSRAGAFPAATCSTRC